MLILSDHFRYKIIVITLGGAILRGVFHIYQGWESAVLFLWGAVAALTVAATGRWAMLFVLHYVNNMLIVSLGLSPVLSIAIILAVLFAADLLLKEA